MKMIYIIIFVLFGLIGTLFDTPCYALNGRENETMHSTKISWNTRNLPITNFGIVKEKKMFSLLLPEINKKKLYSFIPTVGPAIIRNKQVKILLVAFSVHIPPTCGIDKRIEQELRLLKNEFPQNDYILKIYRQINNESQWTQIAQLTGEMNDDDTSQTHIDIHPNALITLYTATTLSPSSMEIDMASAL